MSTSSSPLSLFADAVTRRFPSFLALEDIQRDEDGYISGDLELKDGSTAFVQAPEWALDVLDVTWT